MGLPDIRIERLTPANVRVLDRLAPEVFDAPIRLDRVAAYLADPCNLMLLALAGEVVVGQCAAVVHRHPDKPSELYIDEVGVAPAFRRHGIARRLLDQMLALGKDLQCGSSWVGTEYDNVPARRLYESRGAEPVPFVMYLHEP